MSDPILIPYYPPSRLFILIWIWWLVTTSVWLIRNPTANPWTCLTRLPHVVQYHKLAEYQVIETHVSIGSNGGQNTVAPEL